MTASGGCAWIARGTNNVWWLPRRTPPPRMHWDKGDLLLGDNDQLHLKAENVEVEDAEVLNGWSSPVFTSNCRGETPQHAGKNKPSAKVTQVPNLCTQFPSSVGGAYQGGRTCSKAQPAALRDVKWVRVHVSRGRWAYLLWLWLKFFFKETLTKKVRKSSFWWFDWQ